MKAIQRCLLNSNNIPRDSVLWNMTGSMLVAFQSVIMLMILTRTLGLKDAGIFTIAYANANLFLTIGKFGMRNFQVSDVKGEYSFSTYRYSRLISVGLMLLCSLIYVLAYGKVHQNAGEKCLVIIWMCIFKAVDAYEDVYHGLFQQQGRLDVAGRALTARMLLTIIVFGAGIILTGRLLTALVIATVFTTLNLWLFNYLCMAQFRDMLGTDGQGKNSSVLFSVMKASLPLFIGSFLSFYIGNAPKYAIDNVLSDELQACYGFIAMPVFVVGLLNNFIFNPIIRRLSEYWDSGEQRKFRGMLIRQAGIIAGITLICIIGAYVIGIPVLSFLYNTDLAPYKAELLILLLGGGFLSLSGMFVTAITILRKQKHLVIGYGIVSFAALFLSTAIVRSYGIMGASVLYVGLMALLCVFFWGTLRIATRKMYKQAL